MHCAPLRSIDRLPDGCRSAGCRCLLASHALLPLTYPAPHATLPCAVGNPAALPPCLQVRTADSETCLLLGYTREALKGKSILTLLKPLGEWGGACGSEP